MMEGIGCHAGVFSNAYDLIELGEAWLRGGTLKGVELVPSDVLNALTQRASLKEKTGEDACLTSRPSNPIQAPPVTSRRGRASVTLVSQERFCGWIRCTIWSMCF